MPTFHYVYNSTFLVMFLFRHKDFYPVQNISYSSHISYSSTHIENTDVTSVRSHILKASSFASKPISENAISQLIINISSYQCIIKSQFDGLSHVLLAVSTARK